MITRLKLIPFLLLLIVSNEIFGQHSSRFSIKADVGLCLNFASTKYDELGGPPNKKYFYNKNLLGSSIGLELAYSLSAKSSLSRSYNRFSSSKSITYTGDVNGTSVNITTFDLRDVSHFFNFGYIRKFQSKRNSAFIEGGISLLNPNSQTIALENWANEIDIYQTRLNRVSYDLNGGFFIGLGYSRKIDEKFDIGIRSRLYYMADLNWIEGLSICPTLRYNF
jgi:hypothetical protein